MARTLPRDWLELENPDDPERPYHLDATFLTSRWECIYGMGCPGAWGGGPLHGCCDTPAYFSEEAGDVERVGALVELLQPGEADHLDAIRAGGFWEQDEGDVRTRVIDGACIFLNTNPERPGCALHAAAVARGEDFRVWKPDICSEVPLKIEYHDDRTVLTCWDRELGWNDVDHDLMTYWCMEDPNAYRGSEPVYLSMEPELRRRLGDEVYARLRAALDARVRGGTMTPVGVPVAFLTKNDTDGAAELIA